MAHAATEDVADPAQVLDDQRVTQTKLRHVACAHFRRELGEALGAKDGYQRIARQHAQYEEHDDGYAEYRDRTEGETTQDIAVHEPPVRALIAELY